MHRCLNQEGNTVKPTEGYCEQTTVVVGIGGRDDMIFADSGSHLLSGILCSLKCVTLCNINAYLFVQMCVSLFE